MKSVFDISPTLEAGKAGSQEALSEKSPVATGLTLTSSELTKGSNKKESQRSSFWESVKAMVKYSWLETSPAVPIIEPPEQIIRSLNDFPNGFPNVATFLDSDESFMIYRRFGYVQARLLLNKQQELQNYEEKLDRIDRLALLENEFALTSNNFEGPKAEDRRSVLKEMEKVFCEYSSLLQAAQNMVSLGQPAEYDYKSLENYMWNRSPVCESESKWVSHKEDLVALRPGRDHAWLDSGVEKFLRWFHCGLIERIFVSKETKEKSPNGAEVYYTRSRIQRLVTGIIVLIILILLIIPIYILYHLVNDVGAQKTNAACMGILIVFTLAFSAVLSLFTKAKRHEMLAAAAGYCAVLVVFLGNVSTASSNGL